jgi:hypothetical protein
LQAQVGLTNFTPITQGITVSLSDGTTMTTTYTAILPIPHIFPAIKHSSLLSVRQLCDHGCKAHFDANKVMIRQNGKRMLTGKSSPGTICKLWTLDPYLPTLEQQEKETVNGYVNAALKHDNISNRIFFYHASLFSSVLSTWCDALYAG